MRRADQIRAAAVITIFVLLWTILIAAIILCAEQTQGNCPSICRCPRVVQYNSTKENVTTDALL